MKVIIDCDPGIDDSYALAIACITENVEILAVTIVHGNTSVHNGALNAKLLLDKIYPNKNQPPIYIGSVNPLIANPNVYYFHHEDGLAGTHETIFKNEIDNLKKTFFATKNSDDEPHAAVKILELVNKYPNEITIFALAPLTNLALALKLAKIQLNSLKNKKLVIMGGNEPDGLSHLPVIGPLTNYPEFNFRVDPAAAKIVIDKYLCPITIYTFDCAVRSFSINIELIIEEFEKYIHKSKRCRYLERIGIIHRLNSNNKETFLSCDLVAILGELYTKECNAIYKNLHNFTIEINDDKFGGLLKERTEKHELVNKNIKLCIQLHPVLAYEIFKLNLKNL